MTGRKMTSKLSIYNDWKKIEQKFGIDAWENVREFIWKQQLKIEELTRSRDNWKEKYMTLKRKLNQIGGQNE